ncbi:hypothetical protein ACROYT_G032172 [Oculina patagonica]
MESLLGVVNEECLTFSSNFEARDRISTERIFNSKWLKTAELKWKRQRELQWKSLRQNRIVMKIDAFHSEEFSDVLRRTREKILRTNLREKTAQIRWLFALFVML